MGLKEQKKKALVIAVSEYKYWDSLAFCEDDGKKMIQTLKKCGFEIPKSRQLVGAVSNKKMDKAIKEFFRGDDVDSTDTLLFYYSGHGTPFGDDGYYFVTTETRPDKPDADGFEFDDLTTLSSNSKSEKIIKIVDCCYSGALGAKGSAKAKALVGKRVIKTKSDYEGKGKYLLASSLDTQQSYPKADKSYSEFTYHVIQGLSGIGEESVDANGHVTPYTLGNYVYNMMKDFQEDQRPINKTEGSGTISLAFYNEYVKPKPVITPGPSVEERLIALLKEGKIKEFNNLKRQNPDLLLRLELASIAPSVSLRDIDLSDARLAMIDFKKRDLQGAIFTGAELSGVSFRACNLQYAKLNKVRGAATYFEDADLQNADLSQSYFYTGNFKNAKLENVDFIDTDLRKANFEGVVFVGQSTNFKGANLSEAIFKNAKLDKINLQQQNLSNGDFEGASLQEAQLEKADLSLAKLNRTDLSRSLLRGADLSGADLRESNLIGADLTGANLNGADLSDATLRSSILERANLNSANLREADLEGADLYFADLDYANVEGANLKNSILKGTNFMKIRGLSTNPTVDDSAFDDE